ncbi:hypothetical protein Patl1_09824 [Pistacia atlantica]|uniref:Uncharacterized protein n=1 Tax=Pistacia atlantica TaxID=434234 RepID=A0ACC1A464_9ROSI|nr:hypothetical protein Patl1_09824 [Pistacia atlantica]
MGEPVITLFLKTLEQLQKGGQLITGIQEEVEWIKRELEAMLAFLKEADRGQRRDGLVTAWVGEVRNLVYDAEDIIDTFVIRSSTLRWNLIKHIQMRYQVNSQIRKIKSRVTEVKERRDRYDVLKAVLFEFKSSREEAALDIMDDVNEGQLQERTYRYLENKNYLLVVDDLWEAQLWDELKQALPRDRGLVIFTSRIRDIASRVEDNCHIHELQPLPHELARDIFCLKAFGEEMTCPRELEALTEAIIRRCEGLPLAIVNLAGHLSRTESKQQEMQSLLYDLDWDHNHSTDLERLNKVLVCSYNHLPYYLKYCFLYIGLFPEDYEIGRKRLIRMWVAEGFVQKTSQKSEEEVANSYFKQLIDRSMIQSITLHARDVVKACKLHNLMREVATQMFKEEKFGAILVDRNNEIEDRQRRLSVYSNAENIPANIRLVRLLDLQGVGIESLPDEVGDLINLRNTNVSTLPRGINMLTELRHLHMASFFDRDNKDFLKIPKGKLCFKELQTLSGIDCDQNFMKQLRSLTNLRKLYIGGITGSNSEELCSCLRSISKHPTENLQLNPLLRSPPRLEKLKLQGSLRRIAKDICCSSGGFPKLTSLRILDIQSWERWMPIEEGTMPSLRLSAYCKLSDVIAITRWLSPPHSPSEFNSGRKVSIFKLPGYVQKEGYFVAALLVCSFFIDTTDARTIEYGPINDSSGGCDAMKEQNANLNLANPYDGACLA